MFGSGTRNAPLLCKKSHLYKKNLHFEKVSNLHDGKHANCSIQPLCDFSLLCSD